MLYVIEEKPFTFHHLITSIQFIDSIS